MINFMTARGAEITLARSVTLPGNVVVTIRAADINHAATRITHAQHGAALLIKHGVNESIVPVPAAILPEVDAIFAAAAAHNVKAAAALDRSLVGDAAYDAHHAAVLRMMGAR